MVLASRVLHFLRNKTGEKTDHQQEDTPTTSFSSTLAVSLEEGYNFDSVSEEPRKLSPYKQAEYAKHPFRQQQQTQSTNIEQQLENDDFSEYKSEPLFFVDKVLMENKQDDDRVSLLKYHYSKEEEQEEDEEERDEASLLTDWRANENNNKKSAKDAKRQVGDKSKNASRKARKDKKKKSCSQDENAAPQVEEEQALLNGKPVNSNPRTTTTKPASITPDWSVQVYNRLSQQTTYKHSKHRLRRKNKKNPHKLHKLSSQRTPFTTDLEAVMEMSCEDGTHVSGVSTS